MERLKLLAVGIMLLAACNGPSEKMEERKGNEPVKVGADKDDHGCSVSAGYTWSELKKNCIQIFNEGFRLNPSDNAKDGEVVSAFVLTSEDQSMVELFLPDDPQHSSLLKKVKNLVYENEVYRYDADKALLYAGGKLIYKGNVD